MDTKGDKHLGPVRDEEERKRRMNQGDLSTPSLPMEDRELDLKVPAPNAPQDDDLRPRTQKPGDRV